MNDTPTPPKYKVILADPPWNFAAYSVKGEGRNAKAHYDCMSFEELASLPVLNFAAEDCVLLLWVTDPMLPKGLELIEHWGFAYKTVGFYWAKLNKKADSLFYSNADFFTGLGYWTRSNCEQCLLATRGNPQRLSKSVRKLLISPRREHSRKPDELHERIEWLLPGPYLEMFARSSRSGWTAWGNEEKLFDDGPVETRRFSSAKKKTPAYISLRDLGLANTGDDNEQS